ncbi:MAG TPA: hypothetical protein VK582_04595 [Pyrinomonadaceae bacterium]|nr:hypothetical protein [Pyrinomonadaceae bacterium]
MATARLIIKSLAVVDLLIKVETPAGAGWYRYNHDAYGERPDGRPYDGRNGKGRVWTLLTGERGEYELALGDTLRVRKRLDTMMGFANQGLMIPEQVWDLNKSLSPALSAQEPARLHRWRGRWPSSFVSRSISNPDETWIHQ